jgi:hypothetical protein
MAQEPGNLNTSAGFPPEAAVDRSGAGLSYQKYQMSTVARGTALGMGRRMVPDPASQFSSPPPSSMSGSQFGGSPNAKSTMLTSPGESI